MNTPKILRNCLLSVTLTAIPVVCSATDAPSLSTPAASRQSTGSGHRDHRIQQTAYQAGQKPGFSQSQPGANSQQPASSSVQAELNRMFQQQGQTATAAATTTSVVTQPASSGNIKQVQHRAEDRERPQQKEGLLRRWYRRVTGSDEAEPAVSQSGPQIPSPPPIDYQTRQNGAAPQSGIPARPAGYNSGDSSRQQSGSSSSVMSVQGNYPADPERDAYAKPAQDNRFINPFEQEAVSDADEALLDLDSLIRDRRGAPAAVKNSTVNALSTDSADQAEDVEMAENLLPRTNSKATSIDSVSSAGSAHPKPVQDTKSNSQESSPSADDHFTGYQLPSDDELLGQPEGRRHSEPEPAPPVFAQPASELGSEAPVEQADPIVIKVPLLEEPVMALPRAIPEQSQQQRQEDSSQEQAEEFVAPQPEVQRMPKTSRESLPDSVELAPQQKETSDALSVGSPDLRVLDTQAKREQQRFRIMSRTGQSGFKGFCPVELRDHRELVDAREQHRAKFGLQTYYFSSPEARSIFEANPARYAPAGGGSDVVLLVNTGEETPGSLDFSLWYRDRLYMFRSRETQAMFSQDPRRYADQY